MKYRYFIAFMYFCDQGEEHFSGTGNSFTISDKDFSEIDFNDFLQVQKQITNMDVIPRIPHDAINANTIITNFILLNVIRAEGQQSSDQNPTPEPR